MKANPDKCQLLSNERCKKEIILKKAGVGGRRGVNLTPTVVFPKMYLLERG